MFIFIVECVIKILAQGFFLGKRCYLSDPWNWLDFLVVVTSALNEIPSMKSMSGLRTFRIFRPLRSLQKLPQMRMLINTLFASLTQLGGIMTLAFLLFLIFAILAVSLWAGVQNYRCRLTEFPVDGDWPVFEEDTRICSANRECDAGYYCGSLVAWQDMYGDITVDIYRDSNIEELNYGFTNFDNIFKAFLTIF